MGELGYRLNSVPICGDNQGSIFIASNPVTEKRSKHIDIRYHYIREVLNRGIAEVFFINGDENPADLLTKNLGSVKFLKFRGMYGLEIMNSPSALVFDPDLSFDWLKNNGKKRRKPIHEMYLDFTQGNSVHKAN